MNTAIKTVQDKAGYAPAEAAEFIGLSRSNVYRLMQEGTLKARKFGSRTIILREDLTAFLSGLPPFLPTASQDQA